MAYFVISIVPIPEEYAHHMYQLTKNIEKCPGAIRINSPAIWWKEKGKQGFLTFCQKCYHEGKLTLPNGKMITANELYPAYITGLGCNCDGDQRIGATSIQLANNWKVGVYIVNKTIQESEGWLIHEDVVDISNECVLFDDVLYVPDGVETLSYFVKYDPIPLKGSMICPSFSDEINLKLHIQVAFKEDGTGEVLYHDHPVKGVIKIYQIIKMNPSSDGGFKVSEQELLFTLQIDMMTNKPVIINNEGYIPSEIDI